MTVFVPVKFLIENLAIALTFFCREHFPQNLLSHIFELRQLE
jgi:hypothetical protein